MPFFVGGGFTELLALGNQNCGIVLLQRKEVDVAVAVLRRITAIESTLVVLVGEGQAFGRRYQRDVVGDCDVETLVDRTDHETVDGAQRVEIHVGQIADGATGRRIGGHDVEKITDLRIAERVYFVRLAQRGRHLEATILIAGAREG